MEGLLQVLLVLIFHFVKFWFLKGTSAENDFDPQIKP